MDMSAQEAIMAFSQSEKIKAGLIWVSQAIELASGSAEFERQGAERVLKAIIEMIVQEIGLARKVAGGEVWEEVERPIDRALVMINSGVPLESVVHLTQALSKVTNIGQRSMSVLKDHKLI